jgi:hypothetical protein
MIPSLHPHLYLLRSWTFPSVVSRKGKHLSKNPAITHQHRRLPLNTTSILKSSIPLSHVKVQTPVTKFNNRQNPTTTYAHTPLEILPTSEPIWHETKLRQQRLSYYALTDPFSPPVIIPDPQSFDIPSPTNHRRPTILDHLFINPCIHASHSIA